MSPTQKRALDKFELGQVHSAYDCKERIDTLRALVRLGYLKDVTPFGPGGMFSPTTHYQFKRIK